MQNQRKNDDVEEVMFIAFVATLIVIIVMFCVWLIT